VSIPGDCPLGPVAACVRLLEEARGGQSSSRCLVKMMPLERICFGGDLGGLQQELRALLAERGFAFGEGKGEGEEGQEGAAEAAAAVEGAEAEARPTVRRRGGRVD
jgi:hypothetical protein